VLGKNEEHALAVISQHSPNDEIPGDVDKDETKVRAFALTG